MPMAIFVNMSSVDLPQGELRATCPSRFAEQDTGKQHGMELYDYSEGTPKAKKNYSSRQGDRSGHCRSASSAQAVDLSVWHEVQGFGIW